MSAAPPSSDANFDWRDERAEPIASAPVLSAMLVTGGPALIALLASQRGSLPSLAVAGGALISAAGLAAARGSRWSRLFAVLGIGLGTWSAHAALARAPAFTLLFAVAALTILQLLWSGRARRSGASWSGTFASGGAAKSGAACAAAAWLALAISESAYPLATLVGCATAFAFATVFLLAWIVRSLRLGLGGVQLPLGCTALGVACAVGLSAHPTWAITAWAVGLGLANLFVHPEDETLSAWAVVLDHPARLIVTSFAGLSTLGTLVLALPVSARSGHSVGLLDAAFTAISAACVGGLVVLDTPTTFSSFGQVTLLLLVQVGGLGIMTFYTVALRALGRRLGLRHELAVTEAALVEGQSTLYQALGQVLLLTFGSELCGAVALSALFWSDGLGVGEAAWKGLFTSISSFCNAGIALDTLNMIPYQTRPLVLGVISVLITLGGLAPAVVLATPAWLRGQVVSLQVKLAWIMTLGLLGVGFVSFLALEWSESLAALPWWHKLTNAAFQSVTLRTAGFNSVDLGATTAAAQQIMLGLMFIGGSPGGTAGGVKTTTVALLLMAVGAALRGQPEVVVLGRRVVARSVYRAAAVATVGVSGVFLVLLALLLTQPLPPPMALFEAIGALSTAGLSTGGTALLDGIGKVIIAGAMFVGRVGPLTLFLLLGERRERSPWGYPEAEIDVG